MNFWRDREAFDEKIEIYIYYCSDSGTLRHNCLVISGTAIKYYLKS